MGVPDIKTPAKPAPTDPTKSIIAALNFNETQRKFRRSSGRQGSFLTRGTSTMGQQPLNTALGQ